MANFARLAAVARTPNTDRLSVRTTRKRRPRPIDHITNPKDKPMQLLAIHHSPNPRANDFCFGVEGEIAIPGMACDSPHCGCDRAHIGLSSHAGSTTVLVTDSELTADDLARAVAGYFESAGWGTLPADEVAAIADDVLEVAARFPVGTVLRPTLDHDTDEWVYTPAVAR